jgi:hypothetical protein
MSTQAAASSFIGDVCINSSLIKHSHSHENENEIFTEGQIVLVNFRGRGKWFRATIERVRGFGVYDVKYPDEEVISMLQEESVIWPDAAAASASSSITENDRTYTRSVVMSIANTDGLTKNQRDKFLSHTAILLGILGEVGKDGDDEKSSKEKIFFHRYLSMLFFFVLCLLLVLTLCFFIE